ncbi:MAG TPA: surface-adhesin E family protein [Burkholderiales bacterium]|nr:surface-adhesin E family protein [Burkholderiales bacterium]
MNTNLTLKSLIIAAATFVGLSSAVAAEDTTYWVALSSDVALNHAAIDNGANGEKIAWIERNYAEQISLGEDAQTGQAVCPHQSVQVQYVVNCEMNTINMVSWKMFSGAHSQGDLVWQRSYQGEAAANVYSPQTAEELSVSNAICGTVTASR